MAKPMHDYARAPRIAKPQKPSRPAPITLSFTVFTEKSTPSLAFALAFAP